jgi:hypothetical protein
MRNESRGKIFSYSTDLEKFVKGGWQGKMEGTLGIDKPSIAKDQM